MTFDQQAADEGYTPCARGEQFCELELVRPGKTQCPCDNPDSLAAALRKLTESLRAVQETQKRIKDHLT